MAVMTHRTTFSLDAETMRRLKRLAARWQVSQAEVVRRAVAEAETRPDPQSILEDFRVFIPLGLKIVS
jgi:predicted transcriptional regulator